MEAAVVLAGTTAMLQATDSSPSLPFLASDIAELCWVLRAQAVPLDVVHGAEYLPSLSSLALDITQLRSAMCKLSCVVTALRHEKQQPCPAPSRRSLLCRRVHHQHDALRIFRGLVSRFAFITVVSAQTPVVAPRPAISFRETRRPVATGSSQPQPASQPPFPHP